MIPLCKPYIDDSEFEAVRKVIESGWLTHGPANKEFERLFAEYVGVKHAITVNSCASALFLVLKGLDCTGEVILPSFTFVASANAIVTAGGTPVFVDVDPETCCIDPDAIERSITENTCAIMPVHFAGQMCDMERIMDIADRHGLHIVEDSAETLGGTFDGKQAGAFAHGCFSFFPTKNITTGEGGMVTTNDDDLAQHIRTLAGHGIGRSTADKENCLMPWFRSGIMAGYNMRMSSILAALGVVQMGKIDEMNEQRRAHSHYLSEKLTGIEEIQVPVEAARRHHVYQMYTLRLRGIERDAFVGALRERGIGASVHFDPPVHKQDYYVELGHGDLELPVTNEISNTIVTLPMFPHLTQQELDTIVKAVQETVLELRSRAA